MMANLFGGLLFGTIGFVAFRCGKKQGDYRKLGIGAVLMFYPYFISNTVAMYLVGAVLVAALFFV